MMKKECVSLMTLCILLTIANIDARKTRITARIDAPIDSNPQATNERKEESLESDEKRKDFPRNGQFFRDLFSEQMSEHEIEFGHVCENPDEWEQRFERKDMKANNHRGKVKWGNKNGEYGEHYWDLNH